MQCHAMPCPRSSSPLPFRSLPVERPYHARHVDASRCKMTVAGFHSPCDTTQCHNLPSMLIKRFQAYRTLGCTYCCGNGGGYCPQYSSWPPGRLLPLPLPLPQPLCPCGGGMGAPPAQPFCIIGGGRGGRGWDFRERAGRRQRRTIQPRMERRRRPPTPQAMPMTRLRLSWIQEPTSFATEEPLHWPFRGVSLIKVILGEGQGQRRNDYGV